jgi:hypothetical protein
MRNSFIRTIFPFCSSSIGAVSLGTLLKVRTAAVAVAVAATSLLAAAPASAAWSSATQVIGYANTSNVVAGIDEDGTQQLGFLAISAPEGQGLYNLTRAPGASAWTRAKVFGPINNGQFAFARNGAAVATWQGAFENGKPTVWAAYRPAGKAWAAPAKLDNPEQLGKGPMAVISTNGQAAAVWTRKSAPGVRAVDQIAYAATGDGTWPPSSSLLASIDLGQPVEAEGFNACLPGSNVIAGMLPSGAPIVAWNDPYGSFKEEVTDLVPPDQSGSNEWGVCGVKVATPGHTEEITPRPNVGWNVTPAGALPFWWPFGFEVDPDTGRTALALRGLNDAVTESNAVCDFPGVQESDYCFDSAAFEARVSLGNGTAIAHSGTVTARNVRIALRNGVVAMATRDPAALAAGLGTTLPAVSPLATNASLSSSAIAVGPKGEAQFVAHDAGFLKTFGTPAAGQFAASNDIQTAQASPSLAIGCNGDALLGWNSGANGLFVATNPTGAAQCDGSGPGPGPGPGPGGEEPTAPGGGNPTTPGDSTPGGSTQGGNAGAGSSSGSGSSSPTPPPAAKKAIKCKKGFQRKTVRGKAKCVKKVTGKNRR